MTQQEIKLNQLLMCRVKKLLQHGVIVEVEDSSGQEGFIHISELSKRWVRDVKDVVREGATTVCKVLRVEPQSLELSIKRVTDGEKKQFLKDWSITKRLEKLIANSQGKDSEAIMDDVKKEFGSAYGLYEAMLKEGAGVLERLKLSNSTKQLLLEFMEKSRKKLTLKTELYVQDYDGDGVLKIKELLTGTLSEKGVYVIKYIKAPTYLLEVNAGDVKKTIAANKRILESLEKSSKTIGADFKYKEIKG